MCLSGPIDWLKSIKYSILSAILHEKSLLQVQSKMTGSTPRNATTEADATSGYWSNSASNTLPPPDMTGPYMRFRPLPTAGVEKRRAHIIGSGTNRTPTVVLSSDWSTFRLWYAQVIFVEGSTLCQSQESSRYRWMPLLTTTVFHDVSAGPSMWHG